VIQGFADETTADIFNGKNSKAARRIPREIWGLAARKLDRLNGANAVQDLIDPPGNRLEKLKGSLKEQYSIRVNDQYRIVFRFENGAADDVKLVDYHR